MLSPVDYSSLAFYIVSLVYNKPPSMRSKEEKIPTSHDTIIISDKLFHSETKDFFEKYCTLFPNAYNKMIWRVYVLSKKNIWSLVSYAWKCRNWKCFGNRVTQDRAHGRWQHKNHCSILGYGYKEISWPKKHIYMLE